MHILFLTQIIPYPPDAGPRVKTWHVIRSLVNAGHRVTLASFIRPEEEAYVPVLREICSAVYTVPIRRSRLADIGYWLRSNGSGRPFLIERDDLPEMRRLVERLLASEEIDAIHADQLTMAQFALPSEPASKQARGVDGLAAGGFPGDSSSMPGCCRVPLRVFDAHNAVWTIVERMQQNAPFFLKPVAALEARRVKRYEGMILRRFDVVLAVTEPDRQALMEAWRLDGRSEGGPDPSGRIRVIPIAVDTIQCPPVRRAANSTNIVTLGTLHYPPNADGIRWFLEEVFPQVRKQIPSATLTIIGKNPPQDFLKAAALQPEIIQVTGYVSNLEPYLEKAALMVVPVRAGGGMRVRILEAFSRAMPLVTTTVGLEGIEARPNVEVLLADTAEAFAQTVVRLIKDTELQKVLGDQGRRLAETRYDWKVVLKKMEEIYRTPEAIGAVQAVPHHG